MRLQSEIAESHSSVPEVRDFIPRLPALFDTAGEVIFAGRRNVLKRFEVGSCTLVVKRFRVRNVFQTLAYSTFWHSKARKAYNAARLLLRAGIDTPQPVAWVEERRHGLLRHCYYLTAHTTAQSIRPALEAEPYDRDMAERLAQLIAQLHRHGLVHHDLNPDNVLCEVRDGQRHLSLIDTNRLTTTPPQRLTLRRAKDDFTRWTDNPELLRHVVAVYARERGLDPASTIAQVMRIKTAHNRAWRRRKSFTRWFKRRS